VSLASSMASRRSAAVGLGASSSPDLCFRHAPRALSATGSSAKNPCQAGWAWVPVRARTRLIGRDGRAALGVDSDDAVPHALAAAQRRRDTLRDEGRDADWPHNQG
jgi:hypothetical protein